MNLSKFLAKVIGIYQIIISIAFIINLSNISIYLKDFVENESLMLLTGCMTLIIGLLIVVSHNVWEWSWRVVITIIGWTVLLKGASILIHPHFMQQVTFIYLSDATFGYVTAALDLFVGILLCYFGFRRENV